MGGLPTGYPPRVYYCNLFHKLVHNITRSSNSLRPISIVVLTGQWQVINAREEAVKFGKEQDFQKHK